jgi:lipopolysaccharide/colanic/teichoic acid biosynthesis glycosyltransferase
MIETASKTAATSAPQSDQQKIAPSLAGLSILKRTVDVVLSCACLIIDAPLFVIIAAIIKLEGSGPVFLSQTRVGLHGKTFNVFKFRTMYLAQVPEERFLLHLSASRSSPDMPVFSVDRDPRITPVGRFLRKLRLDELPLLFNVLRGDMSLVGPRAALPYELAHYSGDVWLRLSCRPGITGLWQINGMDNARDLASMARMDLQYIREWSMWSDFRILGATLKRVFTSAPY